MLIQFQSTIDEFREMTLAMGAVARRKRAMAQLPKFMLFWVIIFIVALVFFFLIHKTSAVELSRVTNHLLVAMDIMTFTVCVASIANAFRQGNRHARSIGLTWLGLLALIGIISGVVFSGQKLTAWELVTPHFLWICMTILIAATIVHYQSTGIQRHWEENPPLHRAKTADISVDGVTLSDSVTQHQYNWGAFVRYEETKNLFILMIGESQGIMLPKHAFAGEERVAAFRAMARAISGFTPIGFPVNLTPMALAS